MNKTTKDILAFIGIFIQISWGAVLIENGKEGIGIWLIIVGMGLCFIMFSKGFENRYTNHDKCECKRVEYTNQYADSYKCLDCGKIHLNHDNHEQEKKKC